MPRDELAIELQARKGLDAERAKLIAHISSGRRVPR
jgi:hypothetical protein